MVVNNNEIIVVERSYHTIFFVDSENYILRESCSESFYDRNILTKSLYRLLGVFDMKRQ